ncbi:hypothetical protein [Bilifractor porci]|nr:hypothetical protein [Bilifractor porci]
MEIVTRGTLLFFGGAGLAAVGALMLIIGNIRYSVKKRALRKKLFDRYGF